jgi:hypothetical protein
VPPESQDACSIFNHSDANYRPCIDLDILLPSSQHRLHSTTPLMPVLVGSLLAYAWMSDKKVHIAGICAVLFLVGFSSMSVLDSFDLISTLGGHAMLGRSVTSHPLFFSLLDCLLDAKSNC